MDQEKYFIESVEKAVKSSGNVVKLAENLTKIETPKSNDLTINAEILADYINEFQFDREEEAFYENEYGDENEEERFASETVTKIRQILADIKSGNKYKKIFSIELAYSRLDGEEYSYKIAVEKLMAKTIDEAIKEKDKIRSKTAKQHPDDSSYTLEDVRVKVKIVDQNDNTVLKEKFLLD